MDSRFFRHFLLICTALLAAMPSVAQAPLTNSALKGAYFVRYVGVIGYPNDYPISFAGTMTFDGNGNYTASGSGVYYNAGSQTTPLSPTGTYQIQPSGAVAITNPFSQGTATLYGGVGVTGLVVASSTESGYLDLFVGVPQSASASKSTLSGTYNVGTFEFNGGSVSAMTNSSFTATADGNGNLGTLSVTGSSSALSDKQATQSLPGAVYTLTSTGSGTVTIPSASGVSNQLISGAKNLYVSPDGNFFVAGSPTGWDIEVGVKGLSTGGATIFSGLYFNAYVENDTAGIGVYSSYGASNEIPSLPGELVHNRFNQDGYAGQAYDETFDDSFVPGNNGTASGQGYYFAVSANGNYAMQVYGEGYYSMEVWTKVNTFSGSGVFLNPTGVVNAATNSPFTAQISPGEVISLYGSGFTSVTQPQTAPGLPFPNTLGGVQVTISGTAAPIYLVSPTQINAVVPYSTPSDGSIANIQVSFNGAASNTVQVYTGLTSPGVFTVPSGGVGYGAILHADYSLVSSSSPAKQGETVQLFLTGLGAVTPAVTAGTAAPSTSKTVAPVQIFLDDANGNSTSATVQYQGLAPGLGGLYQVNFTVPSGLTLNATGSTSFTVEVSMLSSADGDTFQALIPVSH